jgi:chaperonin cofactor prefoldin
MNTLNLIVKKLVEKVNELEKRVEYLEDENIGMTNELYELQNHIDILTHPKYQHLSDFSLGE